MVDPTSWLTISTVMTEAAQQTPARAPLFRNPVVFDARISRHCVNLQSSPDFKGGLESECTRRSTDLMTLVGRASEMDTHDASTGFKGFIKLHYLAFISVNRDSGQLEPRHVTRIVRILPILTRDVAWRGVAGPGHATSTSGVHCNCNDLKLDNFIGSSKARSRPLDFVRGGAPPFSGIKLRRN